ERYLKSEVYALVQRHAWGIAEKDVACLQRKVITAPTRSELEIRHVPLRICRSRCLNVLTNIEGAQPYLEGGQHYPHGKQQSVFVGDVQLVQTPKRVIPSPVWLERTDEGLRVLMDVLYLALKPLLLFRGSGLLIHDREGRGTAGHFTVVP